MRRTGSVGGPRQPSMALRRRTGARRSERNAAAMAALLSQRPSVMESSPTPPPQKQRKSSVSVSLGGPPPGELAVRKHVSAAQLVRSLVHNRDLPGPTAGRSPPPRVRFVSSRRGAALPERRGCTPC